METKKRTTKLTLDDIPKVVSPFRKMLLNKLTEVAIYKKAIGRNAALGFSTEELNAIDEKYKNQKGLFNEDIQNEINKKGWLLKATTIKQYIQRDQLPMPKERRKVKGGAASLYPLDFMRHLNFVRFMLNVGREICENILNAFTTPPIPHRMSDYSFLQSMYYDEEIYDGDDRFDPFLYDQYRGSDPFADISFPIGHMNEGLAWHIGKLKFVEAVLNNDDKDFKNKSESERFNKSLKLFNEMKAKLVLSKSLDNEFYDRVKARVQKYLKQLQEIVQTMEVISKRFDLLIEETKKESWT